MVAQVTVTHVAVLQHLLNALEREWQEGDSGFRLLAASLFALPEDAASGKNNARAAARCEQQTR